MNTAEDKKALRRQLRQMRSEMPAEQRLGLSERIADRLISEEAYKNCETVLCFVSTAIEVETKKIIDTAFADGKRVAVPRCIFGTHEMEFAFIESLSELVSGAYGILEPPLHNELTLGGENSICIVPGLSFDEMGYRLGFGGGYYDRFLSEYKGISCGVCYGSFVVGRLPCEECDVTVDKIITEERTIDLSGKQNARV